MKVGQKVDELLEKRRKKKEAAAAAAQQAAIQAGQMPIGIPLNQANNPYLAEDLSKITPTNSTNENTEES